MNHISQDRPTCRCYVKSPTADTREGGEREGGKEGGGKKRRKERRGREEGREKGREARPLPDWIVVHQVSLSCADQ